MQEILVKTHLIIKDIHEEYSIKWCGSIANTDPVIINKKPLFIIRSKEGAIEVNTTDMKYLEYLAKKMTNPRGREAITTDVARIFIKEKNGNEVMLGILVHDHVKIYAPMYDKIGYEVNNE